MILKWDNNVPSAHAALTAMSARAGGGEPAARQEIEILDNIIGGCRGALALHRPEGTDVTTLPADTQKFIGEVLDMLDKSLSRKAEIERSIIDFPPDATAIAKRADVGNLVETFRLAKSRFDDAVAGRLGKLSASEQQEIRQAYTRAEMQVIEARVGR